ncbi:MAG TPA: hypothetical protein VN281_04240 [Verrucomicrobiae bacterium]|jgi:hypothetical protein|nr:hypothetical protein [Verrucomicrobiae bacterium]
MKVDRNAVLPTKSRALARQFKFASATLGAGVLIVAGWFYFEIWNVSRLPVSERLLGRLNSGLDTNAVVRLLGTPQNVDTFTNDGLIYFQWTYSRPSGWKFVMLCFGPDGHFKGCFAD